MFLGYEIGYHGIHQFWRWLFRRRFVNLRIIQTKQHVERQGDGVGVSHTPELESHFIDYVIACQLMPVTIVQHASRRDHHLRYTGVSISLIFEITNFLGIHLECGTTGSG